MAKNIKERINEMILQDLKNTFPKTEEDVWKYRDKYFLSGFYDLIFIEFINELKKKK